MRALVVVGLIAACGGSSPTPASPSNPADPAAASTATAGGTSGLGHLAWGDDADKILAEYPQATPNEEGGYRYTGTAEGMQAVTVFKMDAAGLAGIVVEFAAGLVSMEACIEKWTQLRGTFDGRFGASDAVGFDAYWVTQQALVKLGCYPTENDAVLFVMYSPTAE